MPYNGDSFGKVGARSFAYSRIGRRNLYTKKHIVIASDYCGDIKSLLDNGVPAKNIIACDIEESARWNAEQYGVIVSPFLTIQDTVRWTYSQFAVSHIASINIDLCNHLTIARPVLYDVLHTIHYHGAWVNLEVFFTFTRGRDGFDSDKERFQYLAEVAQVKDYYLYTSWNKYTEGSPMCLATF